MSDLGDFSNVFSVISEFCQVLERVLPDGGLELLHCLCSCSIWSYGKRFLSLFWSNGSKRCSLLFSAFHLLLDIFYQRYKSIFIAVFFFFFLFSTFHWIITEAESWNIVFIPDVMLFVCVMCMCVTLKILIVSASFGASKLQQATT